MTGHCRETFCESGYVGAALQRLVDEIHPCFECEAENCSPFSPGPVTDAESIGFLVIHPIHFDEQRGEVVPEAFGELVRRDLSTIRQSVATKTEADTTRQQLIEIGEKKPKPQGRTIEEVFIAKVSEVRSQCDADGRLLAVYDTGLDDKPGHASIFTRSDVLDGKIKRKRARFAVHQVFSKNRLSYDEFREALA